MRCAVCGKEFGAGNTCQYCGADRVTGLGNYNGYDVPNRGSFVSHNAPSHQENFAQSKIKKVESMVCYACGEIIPTDSRFCPYCNKELYVTCPKCGCEYSSQYPICNKCGTNRVKYNEEQKQISIQKAKEEYQKRQEEEADQLWGRQFDNYGGIVPIIVAIIVWTLPIWDSDIRNSSDILVLIPMAIPVFFVWAFVAAACVPYRAKKRFEKWKKEHPNHRAILYLEERSEWEREGGSKYLKFVGYASLGLGVFLFLLFISGGASDEEKQESLRIGTIIILVVGFLSFILRYVLYRPMEKRTS